MGVEIQVGGSWKEAADRTPIGVIGAFGGTVAPDGWLICDGTAISRTTYADLYAVVGTNFGAGDGSTTFHLPDLRGRFLRGTASGQTTDPDRTTRTAMAGGGNAGDSVGSVQLDAMQGHWHKSKVAANGELDQTVLDRAADASGNYTKLVGTNFANSGPSTFEVTNPRTDGTNGTPRKTSETRPVNAGVNFIIKF